jgi:hypothetical protein
MSHARLRQLDDAALRRIWEGDAGAWPADLGALTAAGREDASWEYWQRFAGRTAADNDEALRAALVAGVPGIGNVVGFLAQRDALSTSQIETAHELLVGSSESDEHGRAHLDARHALRCLPSCPPSCRRLLLQFLLVKGVSWAATEALPLLTSAERDHLLREVDRRHVFTRGQRHDLRALCAALAAP